MPDMTLREAVERYAAEKRAPANAYQWYRKLAHRTGYAPFGETDVAARKMKGSWFVRSEDLAHALDAHRGYVAGVRQASQDYKRGILHGGDGDSVESEDGGYLRRGSFHFVWSNYEIGRRRSDGTWKCSTCMTPAEADHDRPECHRCSDWGSCGRDCTLSRVYCSNCGVSLVV